MHRNKMLELPTITEYDYANGSLLAQFRLEYTLQHYQYGIFTIL